MRTTYAMLLAIAVASWAAGCSKADAPTIPDKVAETRSVAPKPEQVPPPATKAPEVPLPPLPSNITAADSSKGPPEKQQPAARDTPANDPKGDLTAQQESNEMPKANQANNHSSTALDKDPATSSTANR
jgi:hypothetical protein